MNDNEKPKRSLKEAAIAYQAAVPVAIPPPVDALLHGDGKYVSEEDYFTYFYEFKDVSYEWKNGILEAKPMADVAKARMYGWFLRLMLEFLETNPIAGYIILEIGFRMVIPDPDIRGAKQTIIRKPDLGIVLHDNPIPLNDDDNTYQGICDICIESLSDSTQKEIDRDVIEKKREYSAAGVKEYFIIDESNQHMTFYRLNDLGNYVEVKPDARGIIRSTVLNGFEFRMADLHSQPAMAKMVVDPLYRTFVLPDHYEVLQQKEKALRIAQQEQRKRKEEERMRKEAERKREEEERMHQEVKSRADRYEELLRNHGIDPEQAV